MLAKQHQAQALAAALSAWHDKVLASRAACAILRKLFLARAAAHQRALLGGCLTCWQALAADKKEVALLVRRRAALRERAAVHAAFGGWLGCCADARGRVAAAELHARANDQRCAAQVRPQKAGWWLRVLG